MKQKKNYTDPKSINRPQIKNAGKKLPKPLVYIFPRRKNLDLHYSGRKQTMKELKKKLVSGNLK